jgi:protein-disulfide isomerase
MSLRPLFAICMALPALVLGCPAQKITGPDQGGAEASTPAAKVAGETLTVGELDAWIKQQLFDQATDDREPTKLYELRSRALDDLIDERLLKEEAAPLGLTPDELLQKETEKQANVSDEEVLAFYDQNKERMGDAPFEQVKPQILRHLQQQRQQAAGRDYLQALRDKASVEVYLDAPRIQVDATGPSLGPEDAPVTIVEFSDYQCPYCKRAEPVVQQLLERYPAEVRFVFRDYPLDRIHPLARGAAEAAACANQQGRFWEFHRKLFDPGAKLDPESLRQYASDLGLDLQAFQTCMEEHRFQAEIEADLAAGREAGVTGTPAFFVNGIPLKGARPLDDFVAVIEKELHRGES